MEIARETSNNNSLKREKSILGTVEERIIILKNKCIQNLGEENFERVRNILSQKNLKFNFLLDIFIC